MQLIYFKQSFFLELKKMKTEFLASIYQQPEESRSIPFVGENVHMANLFTSRNRSRSLCLPTIVIQNRYPLIQPNSISEI